MTAQKRTRADRFVRIAALASVAALAPVLIGSIALMRSPGLRAASGFIKAEATRGYAVGAKVDVAPELFRNTRFTVLVFVNSACRACVESEPLYSDLVAELRGSANRVKLVGVSADLGFSRYAARVGVPPVETATLTLSSLDALKLSAVPTLLLVDQQGTILVNAVGKQDTVERQALLGAIREIIGEPQ
jgi:hypothetical protein